ncbi:hypothetical protein JKP88DRAFT_278247 [Tribonema minus]|uniref:Uncharacterized protein n=1 Tax=Tribonema minus TaxID=303371 RepID=A0A835YVP2_9STRA|nr:hypothetical protein JKP88DRAFT_278247 [Tribonema minus]
MTEQQTMDPATLQEAYRLRYDTFCTKLGWVQGDPSSKTESDKVLAYTRALSGDLEDTMLGHEFLPMLNNFGLIHQLFFISASFCLLLVAYL